MTLTQHEQPIYVPAEARKKTSGPPTAEKSNATPVHLIDELLYRTLDLKGSDLHLNVGTTPWVSVHGVTAPMPGVEIQINPAFMSSLLKPMVTDEQWGIFRRNKRLDFSYVTERSRFRAHFAVSNKEPMAVFRTIPNRAPDLVDLGLPDVVNNFVDLESGLVLFVGVTGSGKSSSLAGLQKELSNKYAKKIITIEAPVEYLHKNSKSLIVQREVGPDVDSFAIGIEDAMREAPDVIQVGEMRDPETMQAAISAATSGHLVFSTIHAESTADVPTRILDAMPEGRLNDVRSQLSRSLKAVVYQKLLPLKGGNGRAVATEVLIMNPAISAMIRGNNLEGIASQLNIKESGCIPFEASLVNLVADGKVNEAVARRAELKPDSFDRQKAAGRR